MFAEQIYKYRNRIISCTEIERIMNHELGDDG
jgi:hypothetical protein